MLRATDVYTSLLHHRLELARARATAARWVGSKTPRSRAWSLWPMRWDRALEQALAQIERDLAARARLVAETVREEPDREGPR